MKLKRARAKTFLMAIAASLALVGCDNFPAVTLKLVNLKKERVLLHELTDAENIKFSPVRDENGKLVYQPIASIDGGYCLASKEAADVLAWARRQKSKCEAAAAALSALGAGEHVAKAP
jgi:hypothetical protein